MMQASLTARGNQQTISASLPMKQKTVRLKQIATIKAGYPFRGKIPVAPDSTVLAVQMKDVSVPEGIDWSSCTPTTLTGKREPCYLAEGDILVAARGTHNYATLIDQGLAQLGRQAVAAPHFFVVSVKTPEVLPEYLEWLLNQTPLQRHFEQNSEGTLTKSIRRSVLEDAQVVIPPLSKQQTIIAMANTLREEHRIINQLIYNGERMMSAIAHELFNDREVKS